jgi:hypothetical protein
MMLRMLLLLSAGLTGLPGAESFLAGQVASAEQRLAAEVPDRAAWESRRGEYREQLRDMLGLSPEPGRGDLRVQVTGTVEADRVVVEKLHFQSIPGLYVTANYYRPAGPAAGRRPTILYFSGHGPTYGKDGRSCGNKVSYQHHGIWFARHGYNCLILDTVQWGEIPGEHHGTYRLGRWWWVSRGYTPAGLETWSGMRALDYLVERPDVDAEKIGVTGRSGGGAYTWFLTALDDRVRVAAPTAGITSLRDHVMGGVIEGHCDCMFMANVHGWDFDRVAALAAPRPLLIANTDKDSIFPLGGVLRIHESVRRIYGLLGAGDNLGLQIAEGPHEDMQPLHVGAFHWFERFLRGRDRMDMIREPVESLFAPEQLRVFAELPADEINTTVDETFVASVLPDVPRTAEEWPALRGRLTERLFRAVLPVDLMRSGLREFPLYGEGVREAPHGIRRYLLAGMAPDVLRTAFAVTRLAAAAPGVEAAEGDEAVRLLYASLAAPLAPGRELHLRGLPASHRNGPFYPGIMKFMDIPQAVALAAERGKVVLTGRASDWQWAIDAARAGGFSGNLEIRPSMEVVSLHKVWEAAPHNAFTSLLEYRGQWFLAFREGSAHVPGTDGVIRVLVSGNALTWQSAAVIGMDGIDLRDPRLSVAPDGRMLLSLGGSVYDGSSQAEAKRRLVRAVSHASFSADGRVWTAPEPSCEPGQWLWRATTHQGQAYGVAYAAGSDSGPSQISLWSSPTGGDFRRVAAMNPGAGLQPNETTLRFQPDGSAVALVRCEKTGSHAMVGVAVPPWRDWAWHDCGERLQGPDLLLREGGQAIWAGRMQEQGRSVTGVGWLTAQHQALPQLRLPSGGDNSYPALALRPDGQLLCSYYSSHEGRAAIYVAVIRITP